MKGFNNIRWVGKMWDKISTGIQPIHKHNENSMKSPDMIGQKPKLNKNKWMAIIVSGVVIIVGLVFAGKQYVNANQVAYYNVYVQDHMIGNVQEPTQIEQLFSQKRQEYKDK